MKTKCCGRMRSGNFCSNCGQPLVLEDVKIMKLKQKLKKMQEKYDCLYVACWNYCEAHNKYVACWNYCEAHNKKMCGSTIQYTTAKMEECLGV